MMLMQNQAGEATPPAAGVCRRRAAAEVHELLADVGNARRRITRRPTRRWAGVVLVTVVLVHAGCSAESPAQPQPLPPQVTVAHPIQRDVIDYQEFTGRTAAVEVVDIRARVNGVIEAVHFKPGTIVRRGDPLFSIDPAPYVAARNAAVANVRTTEAALGRARSDLARLEQAIRTNAVSAQAVDRARADVRQYEASLLGEQARLEQAELSLSYTEIRAPIQGLIGLNQISTGNVVGAAETQPLATLMQIDPMYAYFDVSETLVLDFFDAEYGGDRLRSQDDRFSVSLGLANEEGWPHEGYVDYVDSAADPGTGTIRIRGRFPNTTGKLFPGLFARLRVPGNVQADALLVLERAIGTDLGGKYVLVVGNDDIVELRHVELGVRHGDLRVITAGLHAGERYITNGVQRARPGLPVTPMMEEAPSPEPTYEGPSRR